MVNRCICFNKTFTEILDFAQKYNLEQTKIEETLKCGTRCGLCKPYIEECLRTKKTEFFPKTLKMPNKQ